MYSLVRRNGEGWLDLLLTFRDQSEYNSDMADVCFLKSGVDFKLHGRNLKKDEKLLWRLNIAGSGPVYVKFARQMLNLVEKQHILFKKISAGYNAAQWHFGDVLYSNIIFVWYLLF